MKVRTSFVSNSSSASFILTIPMSKKKAYDFFIANDMFNLYDLRDELAEEIKYIEEHPEWHSTKIDCIKQAHALIKEDTSTKNKYAVYTDNRMDYYQVIDASLGRKLFVTEKDSEVLFTDSITMFNEYNDFASIIKQMVFILVCNRIKFEFKIEDD